MFSYSKESEMNRNELAALRAITESYFIRLNHISGFWKRVKGQHQCRISFHLRCSLPRVSRYRRLSIQKRMRLYLNLQRPEYCHLIRSSGQAYRDHQKQPRYVPWNHVQCPLICIPCQQVCRWFFRILPAESNGTFFPEMWMKRKGSLHGLQVPSPTRRDCLNHRTCL
jgi:hypothetical protein